MSCGHIWCCLANMLNGLRLFDTQSANWCGWIESQRRTQNLFVHYSMSIQMTTVRSVLFVVFFFSFYVFEFFHGIQNEIFGFYLFIIFMLNWHGQQKMYDSAHWSEDRYLNFSTFSWSSSSSIAYLVDVRGIRCDRIREIVCAHSNA